MKLETFFEKFELFAEAPGAVNRMRKLVLDLAATGRLLADKNKNNWEKHALKTVTTKIGSGATPAGGRESYFSEGTPLIRSMNVHFRGFEKKGLVFLSDKQADGLSNVIVQANDVLLNITGASIGRVTIAPIDMTGARVNQHVTIIRPTSELLPKFLSIFLASPTVQRMIDGIQVGATRQALTKGMIEQFKIPLPPLAEQKRIVTKVNELMALCDQLEAQQQEREAQRSKLARASLARFAKVPTPANLVPLFHPTYNITPTDLRKSILTLAVQGKIVPQDPNDEPANTLLERITRNLSQEQIRRRSVSLSPLPSESLQYELPDSWTWAYFRDVAMIASNLVDPDCFLDFTHLAPDNIEKGSGVLLPCATVREDKVTSKNHRFYSGQIVYSKIRPNLSKVVVVDFEGLCSADMYPIDSLVNVFYLQLYMLSDPFLTQAVKTDTRVAMPKINQAELNTIAVPVPPLAEQRRIVAKVKELMAIADQLEAQLANEKSASTALLDAAIHGLLNPIADVIAFPAVQATAIDRAGIGCYVVQKLASHKTFGRVALMKHEYLAEAHVGATLDGQYQRQAAGPLDSWVYRFEEDAVREGWFTVEETKTRDGHKKIIYRKGAELDVKASAAFAALPQAQRDELDRMLTLLGGKPTEEVEIIATLFAVWNDSLIDGHSPSDDEIVTGFREHWHEKKQKFTAKSLHTWLDWMRRNSLVPTGRGPRTRSHPGLDLH